MLVILRKPKESIKIIRPDGVVEEVKVLSVTYGQGKYPIVRLGIDAPDDTKIYRSELLDENGNVKDNEF